MITLDVVLTWLLLYGYPVLFGVVLAAALGAPIPANLTLLAAGGFVAQGELELLPVVGLVFGAAMIGDCTVYTVAGLGGERLLARHGERVGLGADRLDAARGRIGRWMSLSLFLTRWLVTPLAAPVAVVAGLSHHSPAAFVASVAAGELLWAALYLGIGYLFGDSWPGLLSWVEDSAALVAGVGLAVAAGVTLLWLLRRDAKR